MKTLFSNSLSLLAFHFMIGAASVALIASSAFAMTKYTCQGVQGTKGELKLSVGERVTRAVGSYEDEAEGSVSVICQGQVGRAARGFTYFDTNGRVPSCRFDTIKVPAGINDQEGGVVSLVSRTGGDGHDWSGYSYRYFYCK